MIKYRLVVGPLNLLMQWKQEIERFFKRSQLNAIIYHGSERKPTEILDAKRSDVILTTYGTITSEYTGGDSMFHKIHWHRIILDEAHMIKEKSTGVAKSCCALLSDYRWCVTGTPVINKIE